MSDGARDVAIITPWYPDRQLPFAGAFVRAMVAAVAPGCDRTTVYHLDGWPARAVDVEEKEVVAAADMLVQRGRNRATTVAGADLMYVPIPVGGGRSYAQLARRYDEALRTFLGGKPLDAAVVHGHVGLRGGWVAMRNAAPGAKVFVTEHATYLSRVLGQPDSREMYDEVIGGVTGFFAVGEPVRQPLVEAFPHHADKIQLIPNPIPFDTPRQRPVERLRRWLYMGNLIERKGVGLLLEAFAKCRSDDQSLTLTFVGDGPLRPELRSRAASLSVSDAVKFVDPLAPDAALAALREHDLLVHPSRLETFGMTIVEAVASGTPVLVTRCGGPEESLAGIETLAGEFIDVTDDPQTIVDGFRRLQARFPDTLDLPYARTVVEERYGYASVGRAHHEAWFGSSETAGR